MVVAADPDSIVSFAYGVDEAPITTMSVDVEIATRPTLLVVQPPALDVPPVAMVPQTTLPEPSVCSACAAVHARIVFNVNVLPMRVVPETLRFPVVVAPPEIVRPPICVPFPIVVEATDSKPDEKTVSPEKTGLPENVGDPVNVPVSDPPAIEALPSVAFAI